MIRLRALDRAAGSTPWCRGGRAQPAAAWHGVWLLAPVLCIRGKCRGVPGPRAGICTSWPDQLGTWPLVKWARHRAAGMPKIVNERSGRCCRDGRAAPSRWVGHDASTPFRAAGPLPCEAGSPRRWRWRRRSCRRCQAADDPDGSGAAARSEAVTRSPRSRWRWLPSVAGADRGEDNALGISSFAAIGYAEIDVLVRHRQRAEMPTCLDRMSADRGCRPRRISSDRHDPA